MVNGKEQLFFPEGGHSVTLPELLLNEPCHEKTGSLHVRKQRRRSAVW